MILLTFKYVGEFEIDKLFPTNPYFYFYISQFIFISSMRSRSEWIGKNKGFIIARLRFVIKQPNKPWI